MFNKRCSSCCLITCKINRMGHSTHNWPSTPAVSPQTTSILLAQNRNINKLITKFLEKLINNYKEWIITFKKCIFVVTKRLLRARGMQLGFYTTKRKGVHLYSQYIICRIFSTYKQMCAFVCVTNFYNIQFELI